MQNNDVIEIPEREITSMKTFKSHPQIERPHCMKNRASQLKHTALVLAVICLTSGLALPGYCWTPQDSSQHAIAPAANSAWKNTGNLNTARYLNTATLLPNGKVLVAGGDAGWDNPTVNSAELYDPAKGTWTATSRRWWRRERLTSRSAGSAPLVKD